MFLVGWSVRIAAVGAVVYGAYRAGEIYEEYQREQQHTSEQQTRGKCIICDKEVEPSQKKYRNSCNCLAHSTCMLELIREGQEICPKCKEPLDNPGSSATHRNVNPGNSNQSSDGTSTTRRFKGT